MIKQRKKKKEREREMENEQKTISSGGKFRFFPVTQIFFVITSKVRVRDTHEHRISTHTIVTAELYAIPKREVFFLFPRFCIFIYLFILVFFCFFSFWQLTKLDHCHPSSRHVLFS